MPSNPLIMLHGALGSQAQLAALKKQLASQYEVYSLDFEGHGDNRSNGKFSMDVFAQNVISFMGEKDLSKTHIFGYSMGGYVALQLALLRPDLVDKVVTYGTKFDWQPETAAREVKMLNPEVIQEKVPKFAAHLEAVHGAENWKAVLKKTADMMIGLGNKPPLNADTLTQIHQQVLIGIGTNDNMVSVAESETTVASLKNGTLLPLEGFVHPIERNDSVVLAKVIDTYLRVRN